MMIFMFTRNNLIDFKCQERYRDGLVALRSPCRGPWHTTNFYAHKADAVVHSERPSAAFPSQPNLSPSIVAINTTEGAASH